MILPEHDWQAQVRRSLARHVNLLLDTHFGSSRGARPGTIASDNADRSTTGMTAPARGGTGNTVRDILIRAGSRTPPSSPSRTGAIVGSTPPIVPSADLFDFHIFSGAQDSLSLPDAGDLDVDPAADDTRDPMPLWPDVPIGTPGAVGPVRRSARRADQPSVGDDFRSMPIPKTSASAASAPVLASGPITVSISLDNRQVLFTDLLRKFAREFRQVVVEVSTSTTKRGVWDYAEQLRVSMGR